MARQLLLEPTLAGVAAGSPDWFARQKVIILSRPLLKGCYDLWYRLMLEDADSVPVVGGLSVELGSGGGHLKDLRGDVITSDVLPGVADRVIDAVKLPFADGSVRALFLTQTFHHVPDVARFLEEADRVLVPGGVISMVEVAATPLARLLFSRFHPEPFLPSAPLWSFVSADSLRDANQALSWIVFERDRTQFETKFPRLRLEKITLLPWVTYLASGGVTRRNLAPRFMMPALRVAESLLRPLRPIFALHWHLRVRKTV